MLSALVIQNNGFASTTNGTSSSRNYIDALLQAHEYEGKLSNKRKRKSSRPIKNLQSGVKNTVVDLTDDWTKIVTCCGIMYKSKEIDAVIIDANTHKLCDNHQMINKKTEIKTDEKMLMIVDNQVKKPDTALIRHIKNATNAILNQPQMIIGSKVTDNVNVPTTAVKKHHLYSKRQNIIDHVNRHENNLLIKDKTDVSSSSIAVVAAAAATTNCVNVPVVYTQQQQQQHQPLSLPPPMSSPTSIRNVSVATTTINKTAAGVLANNYLHKLNSGKIVKTVLERPVTSNGGVIGAVGNLTASKVKNFVKICTEKSMISNKVKLIATNGSVVLTNGNGVGSSNNGSIITANSIATGSNGVAAATPGGQPGNELITDALGNKFMSDNSSDSGYEETPAENVNVSCFFILCFSIQI